MYMDIYSYGDLEFLNHLWQRKKISIYNIRDVYGKMINFLV